MRVEQQANWFAASKQFRGHMHKQTHRGYRIHGWERKGLRDICKFSSLYLFGVAPGRFVCERGASGACYGKKRALLSGKQSQSPVQQKWPKEWLSKAAISRSPMASAQRHLLPFDQDSGWTHSSGRWNKGQPNGQRWKWVALWAAKWKSQNAGKKIGKTKNKRWQRLNLIKCRK